MQALLVAALCVALLCVALLGAARLGPRGPRRPRRGYLVAPYLDLDRPGERGAPYALAEADAYAGDAGCGKVPPWNPWHPGRGARTGFHGTPSATAPGHGWRTPAYYWRRHDVLGRGRAPAAWAGGAGAWRR